MKTFILFSLLLGLTAAWRPAAPVYLLNPASSRLMWTGYAEVGSYAPSGSVRLAQGTLSYDGQLRAAQAVVDLRTISHENATMQGHLRGVDFFDVQRFPTATFTLREARAGRAAGQLTIKGVTAPLEFPLSITSLGPDSLLLKGSITIDRTKFGLRYNSSSFFQNLGDQAIRNDFRLGFSLKAGRRAGQ